MHEVRDPVHGFILFDDLERDIINSAPFQRLRRIKQLAMTHYVYPGATHTRFEHSLGVMELAGRVFELLQLRAGNRLQLLLGVRSPSEWERLRRILRLAALLHDVGHTPFSHGPEDLIEGDHETMTARIIAETEIKQIIDEEHYDKGVRVRDVIPVAVGPKYQDPSNKPPSAATQFLTSILTGPFGVDRMDYLLRDSLHTGARYGQFDVSRLIHTLTVVSDDTGSPRLAIESGGLHAAEGMLLARYFMFQQVYFHSIRRIYDLHLKDAFASILPEGKFPADVTEYLALDDALMEVTFREASPNSDPCRRIVQRDHYRVAWQAPMSRLQELWRRHQEFATELGKRFGAAVILDADLRALAKASELETPVVQGAKIVSSWHHQSEVLSNPPSLGFMRVYCPRDDGLDQKVGTFCRDYLGV